MSDCSYAAMSNHKLTVANLCVKSNSMWTNFADNGKIHTCMYNVCTLYTTAVGVILPRQLARFRYAFCSLRSHGTRFAYGRLRAQALSQPCLIKGRAEVERFALAANGAIERFGNLVHHELMNVWRDSILFASLTRHTIVANATIKTVPCHGKSGCLRLRSN